jgi:hypothetical protein
MTISGVAGRGAVVDAQVAAQSKCAAQLRSRLAEMLPSLVASEKQLKAITRPLNVRRAVSDDGKRFESD